MDFRINLRRGSVKANPRVLGSRNLAFFGFSVRYLSQFSQTAAATASPICVVLAFPPRSAVRCLASAITLSIAVSMSFAACVAFSSPRVRPSYSISIFPDMIMA